MLNSSLSIQSIMHLIKSAFVAFSAVAIGVQAGGIEIGQGINQLGGDWTTLKRYANTILFSGDDIAIEVSRKSWNDEV
jgi:hypothetical protein